MRFSLVMGYSGHSCFENIPYKSIMCKFNSNLSFINFVFHLSVLGHNSQMKILLPEQVSSGLESR